MTSEVQPCRVQSSSGREIGLYRELAGASHINHWVLIQWSKGQVLSARFEDPWFDSR